MDQIVKSFWKTFSAVYPYPKVIKNYYEFLNKKGNDQKGTLEKSLSADNIRLTKDHKMDL